MQREELQAWSSTNCVQQFITSLLQKMDADIQIKQAMNRLPSFLANIINEQIYEINFPIILKDQISNELKEQNQNSIPKISRDTLMPKYIHKQKDESESPSLKISTLNIKNTSSITKKISTTARTMKSVSLSEKRSMREKKVQSPCQGLPLQQNEEDIQIQRLREKTEMRLMFDLQLRKMNLFRQKSFRQKSKMLDDLVGQQTNVRITHDYEGEQLKSSIIDDKIKHYSMIAQFGTKMKRKKQELFNRPVQMSIVINRYQKQKDFANKVVRPMEMPLFSVDHRDLAHLHEVKNYKLHDYKKHFGRKYSRLDQYSQTLQLNTLQNKDDQKQQIFSERKHLRDSSLLQGSRESLQAKGHIRKLALPRLHGKYKVLDRYDEI